jgi:hypothetical protein
MIHRDSVRENVPYLAVLGLNPGKDETVKQNREALTARQRRHGLVSLPGLREDLRLFRMFAAIDEPNVVSQSC